MGHELGVQLRRLRQPEPRCPPRLHPGQFHPPAKPLLHRPPLQRRDPRHHKPEAKIIIPWFREAFTDEGKSVCRDRWIAVRNSDTGKICYAQWSDCGPFRTDHWQYVFGPEKPKPNLNQGAGLDISPAVRDYLGLGSTDVTDWKFVDAREVPNGPWAQFGENNDFVKNARRTGQRVVSAAPGPVREAPLPVRDEGGPTVIVK